jgi:hypothetical protein
MMGKIDQRLNKLTELHSQAIEKYRRSSEAALELLNLLKTGAKGGTVSASLKKKQKLADELVILAGVITAEREKYQESAGDLRDLRKTVDEFNENLQPIIIELIDTEKKINGQLNRVGIKISDLIR